MNAATVKYCVLIMDGAAGWPLQERGGRTCLELARTPNLDALAKDARVGKVRTVPCGMEPSSACACMSLLGYDPRAYYRGRGSIEARSMEIPVAENEAVFRCNLVSVRDGKMHSYSSGYIANDESHQLIRALNDGLGDRGIEFFPGISYRHICRVADRMETLQAKCTPAHDIPGAPISEYLPTGAGSEFLRDLMARSVDVLADHPVNRARLERGDVAANMIWLFWGSGQIPPMPAFETTYGLSAAMTSGVDLLLGLAKMANVRVLDIPGVTGDIYNDYQAQITGGLKALDEVDLVVIHVEAPDEAGHDGSVEDKVQAIECIDNDMVGRLRELGKDKVRVLIAPDHPTPLQVQTHVADPVPFLIWGEGFTANGASRFTESEAEATGAVVDEGFRLMRTFTS
jgi:2,3-bisphosphoglycerate-independent phosphoglycerate mutase